jgi:hypothetical protein
MIDKDILARASWRKSSYSGGGGIGGGECVEVAPLPDGRVAIRDSKDPCGGVLCFASTELVTLIQYCKSADLDDLTRV